MAWVEVFSLGHRYKLRQIKHFYASPWRQDSDTILLRPKPHYLSSEQVKETIALLQQLGISDIVTSAMRENETDNLVANGFECLEQLYLLSAPVAERSEAHSTQIIRSARPWHDRRLIEIDRQCFDKFWQFDLHALNSAKNATNVKITRVAVSDGIISGYAVTGLIGSTGYLQRLAVSPSHTRQGIGAALVEDSMRWLRRRGASIAMVNTQLHNEAALALYSKLGFSLENERLLVLKWQNSDT